MYNNLWSRIINNIEQIDVDNVKITLDNNISYIFDKNYILPLNFHGGTSMSNCIEDDYVDENGIYNMDEKYVVIYYQCIDNTILIRNEIKFKQQKLASKYFNHIIYNKIGLETSDKLYMKVSSLLTNKQYYLYSIIYDFDNIHFYNEVVNELKYLPEFGSGYYEALNSFNKLKI